MPPNSQPGSQGSSPASGSATQTQLVYGLVQGTVQQQSNEVLRLVLSPSTPMQIWGQVQADIGQAFATALNEQFITDMVNHVVSNVPAREQEGFVVAVVLMRLQKVLQRMINSLPPEVQERARGFIAQLDNHADPAQPQQPQQPGSSSAASSAPAPRRGIWPFS